jgi:hypothetical protein
MRFSLASEVYYPETICCFIESNPTKSKFSEYSMAAWIYLIKITQTSPTKNPPKAFLDALPVFG